MSDQQRRQADDHRQAGRALRQPLHRPARHQDQQRPQLLPDQPGRARPAGQATAAQQSGAANAADLQSQSQATEAKAATLFQGETLRGLLLTSYGFSIFGDRAQTAAWVCYAVALVLFVAGIFGLILAFSPAGAEHVFGESKQPTLEPSQA